MKKFTKKMITFFAVMIVIAVFASAKQVKAAEKAYSLSLPNKSGATMCCMIIDKKLPKCFISWFKTEKYGCYQLYI